MSLSGLPFDDIRELISSLPLIDERAEKLTIERNDDLRGMFGFGDHEARLCEWLAGWSGKSPAVTRPLIALFAGTHQVNDVLEETSDQSTLVMATRMAAGGAPVNQVCATNDIGLKVFDLALQFPVGDITKGEALDEKGSAATIGFGMEAIAGGVDLLGLAAFGQGGEVANIAILSLLSGEPPETFLSLFPESVGEQFLKPSRQAIEQHKSAKDDPLELLRRLGGREHSALAGAILAARVNHVPAVLDGISAICVAGLLNALDHKVTSHCQFAASGNSGGKDALIAQITDQDFGSAVLRDFAPSQDGSTAGNAIAVLKSVAAIHANTVLDNGQVG